ATSGIALPTPLFLGSMMAKQYAQGGQLAANKGFRMSSSAQLGRCAALVGYPVKYHWHNLGVY
ncbi:MAG: hypothetical protein LBI76_04250, partial [Comamonas sp.]|nr:hypothetical protein [Comamonas sp.]